MPSQVALLADRRAGIGGDGVIRVVPTSAATEESVRAQAARLAGSWTTATPTAAPRMCGNGSRVFAAYLRREGLETADEFAIATRSGVKRVRFESGGLIAVNLGPWRFRDEADAGDDGIDALVHLDGHQPSLAVSLDLGNPHTVVALPRASTSTGSTSAVLPWSTPPRRRRGPTSRFVRPHGLGHLSMRVHERGVGETRSCGTGACAAALATRFWAGEGAPDVWTVDVPGGRLRVTALPGHEVELAGPAVLVADGVTTLV